MDTILEEADAAGLTPILDIGAPPRLGVADTAQGRERRDAQGGRPRRLRDGSRDPLRRQHPGPARRARVPGLERAEPQPRPGSRSARASYRAMVNAVADAVHAVDPSNLVVAGALDPFGHPKSKKQKWYSVAPLAYHALAALPLEGGASARDLPQPRALRRLVAPSVHVRRPVRAREESRTTSSSAICRRCGRC